MLVGTAPCNQRRGASAHPAWRSCCAAATVLLGSSVRRPQRRQRWGDKRGACAKQSSSSSLARVCRLFMHLQPMRCSGGAFMGPIHSAWLNEE